MRRERKSDTVSGVFRRLFFTLLFLAYVVGGLYFAYLFFGTLRALAQQRSVAAPIPRVVYGTPLAEPTPPPPVTEQQPPPPSDANSSAPRVEVVEETPRWDRGPVNILLLGVDQRACEDTGGAWRTDTMILVGVNPDKKSVSVLSFPRDLWVHIPTVGENRLNAAHFFGDAYHYPGGGPALAKRTIQANFGVPVHYYIRVNFDGFRKIVDALGGIDIKVEEPLWDDRYPTDDCGYQTIRFDVGEYHMNGEQALQYARSRHYTSDFSRMRRQQQVLLAIYKKATSLEVIPRLPELWAAKGEAIQTDLSLLDVLKLARLGMQIDKENIRFGVIDENMTYNMVTPKGWQVLNWDRVKVGRLIRELFGPVPDGTESSSSSSR